MAPRSWHEGLSSEVPAESRLLDALGRIAGVCMASADGVRTGGLAFLSLCSEKTTRNWSGQGESDCLIKTKHCDGLKRC